MPRSGRGQREDLLRRLSLADENVLRRATSPGEGPVALDTRTRTLVLLAAQLAVGAGTTSCRATVDRARRCGVSDDEIVDVLLAVAPAVGAVRLVDAAPRLALAIDIDVSTQDERPDDR